MPENIRPRVNEAKEFLEIAKDFKDPKEIIREALSNSWDAGASRFSIKFALVKVPGTARQKIMVEIQDNGLGMSSENRSDIGASEIASFFNLGDSNKTTGSIGSKGHHPGIDFVIGDYSTQSGVDLIGLLPVPWTPS